MRTTEQASQRNRLRRTARLAVAGAVLAAIPMTLTVSSASFTSRSANAPGTVSSAIDWTAPTVAVVNPGDGIRGVVTLTAQASDGETGIAQVTLSWAPTGTTTWTTLCTDTAAPYACAFDTTAMGEAYVDLQAVATDRAGFSSTARLDGVLVDNVAPAGALGDLPTVLSGTVTVTASATDSGSGVASVTMQYAPAGTSGWVTICSDTLLPWSCRFDTSVVADGTYDLRAVITDTAGNSATTALLRNRQVDNRQSSVSMATPNPYLRGIETLTADAHSNVGVVSVRIQRSLVGTTTWTDVCTLAPGATSCPWDTTTVPDGAYTFRAVLLDGAGKTTTSAVVGPAQVDNTPVRGLDVQATNGGTLGRLDAGDAVALTYSRTLRATSVLAGWDGTARAVVVRVRDGATLGLGPANDTIDVFTSTAYQTRVNVGSVDLRGDYLQAGKTVAFNATMTATTVTVNGVAVTRITLLIGSQAQGGGGLVRAISTIPTMVWSPASTALDVDGLPVSSAPVTETGAADRDL